MQFQQLVLIFLNNLPKQGYFQTKTSPMNITTVFLFFELV